MYVPSIAKARTVMTQSGLRINWKRVSYFSLEATKEHYIVGIRWKYKASLRTEYINLNIETDLYKYFKQHGLVKFEDIYVNLNKILLIEEKAVHGPNEKTRVRLLFEDGFEVIRIFKSTDWVWWKTTYA